MYIHFPHNIWAGLIAIALIAQTACDRPEQAINLDAANSGGDTTVFNQTEHAFGLPARNIRVFEREPFVRGRTLFEQQWTIEQGLGPLYHANACDTCHQRDGRSNPFDDDTITAALLLRTSTTQDGKQQGVPALGWQIDPFAIEGMPEAHINVEFEHTQGTYPDNTPYQLVRPKFTITPTRTSPHSIELSPRTAPPLIGLGLLEAIDRETLQKMEDPEDQDNDGVSGRIHWVRDPVTQENVPGRFGWKAAQPTLDAQNSGALRFDMGLTSSRHEVEDCGVDQPLCMQASASFTEVSNEQLGDLLFYTAMLAVPGRRNIDRDDVKQGEALFTSIGCAKCHTPELETGTSAHSEALSNQTIRPYTDLLLHDMGTNLADNRIDQQATGREWRTPPLWGIGLTQLVNGHTRFLHDGRARSVEEAILWHGGESNTARTQFMALTKIERDAVLAFIKSL